VAGYQVFPREQRTPEALRSLVMSDIEKWWPIIKAFGIKAAIGFVGKGRALNVYAVDFCRTLCMLADDIIPPPE
jgi:hypothetical protein